MRRPPRKSCIWSLKGTASSMTRYAKCLPCRMDVSAALHEKEFIMKKSLLFAATAMFAFTQGALAQDTMPADPSTQTPPAPAPADPSAPPPPGEPMPGMPMPGQPAPTDPAMPAPADPAMPAPAPAPTDPTAATPAPIMQSSVAPAPTVSDKDYPVCSKTVTDSCRNGSEGGMKKKARKKK
jgi:hypothetical protein